MSAPSVATLLPLLLMVFAAAKRDEKQFDEMNVDVGILQVGGFIFNEYTVLGRLPSRPKSVLEFDQSSMDGVGRRASWEFPFEGRVKEAKEIGKGAFGVAFKVKTKKNETYVMKFWHFNGEYVTLKDIQNPKNSELKQRFSNVKMECSTCAALNGTAEIFRNSTSSLAPDILKGTQRTMHCFGSKTGRNGDEPFYILLDYAGKPCSQITTGLRDTAANLEAMLSLIKQLFEGLAFLAKAGWLHHDLKIDNLVAKTLTKGDSVEYALHLIDFDGAVKPDTADPDTLTPSTPHIAPKEMMNGGKNFDTCGGSCPYAFDVFSAGVTALEMVCGQDLYKVFASETRLEQRLIVWDYEKLAAISVVRLIDTLKSECNGGLPAAFAKHIQGSDFVKLLLKTLSLQAKDRPTAMDILQSDLMKNITTPNDDR